MSGPRIDTPAQTPLPSLIFGYGPVLLILTAAVGALVGLEWAAEAGRVWSASILVFLGGVTRGLSFFTYGGPRWSQIATMLLRFVLGLAALVLPAKAAFVVLLAGYASIPFCDRHAARRGAAPRFFSSLRVPQTTVALLGLILLLIASP